jgi:hypothetical protein
LKELSVIRLEAFDLRIVNVKYHLSEGDEAKAFWKNGSIDSMRKRIEREIKNGGVVERAAGDGRGLEDMREARRSGLRSGYQFKT